MTLAGNWLKWPLGAFCNSNKYKSLSNMECCQKTRHCLLRHKSTSWCWEATWRAHQLLATARWMGWLLELMWQLRLKASDSIMCVQSFGTHFYLIIHLPGGTLKLTLISCANFLHVSAHYHVTFFLFPALIPSKCQINFQKREVSQHEKVGCRMEPY